MMRLLLACAFVAACHPSPSGPDDAGVPCKVTYSNVPISGTTGCTTHAQYYSAELQTNVGLAISSPDFSSSFVPNAIVLSGQPQTQTYDATNLYSFQIILSQPSGQMFASELLPIGGGPPDVAGTLSMSLSAVTPYLMGAGDTLYTIHGTLDATLVDLANQTHTGTLHADF